MANKKWFWPTILSIAVIVIFIASIFIFDGVIKNYNNMDSFYQNLPKDEKFTDVLYDMFSYDNVKYEKKGTVSKDNSNKVIASYLVTKDNKEVGYAYFVKTKGWAEDFNIIIGINSENKELPVVAGYEIYSYKETFLDKISIVFKSAFKNKDMTDPYFGFSYEGTSGATMSADALILAANLAREQYYFNLGQDVPKANIALVSINQQIDENLYFIANYNKNGSEVSVTFKNNNNVLEYISSSSLLIEEERQVVTELAQDSYNRSNQPIILDYTEGPLENGQEGYLINVRTKNQFVTIVTRYQIDKTNGQIVDFELISRENHSYGKNEEFNNHDFGLIGSTEENYQNNFNNLTEATVSCNSVKDAARISFALYKALNGGNANE